MAEMNLLVSFPDQSASFVHGFEAGQIWQRLSDGETLIEDQLIHRINAEVIDRMALQHGCYAEWRHIDGYGDTYSYVTIRKDTGS